MFGWLKTPTPEGHNNGLLLFIIINILNIQIPEGRTYRINITILLYMQSNGYFAGGLLYAHRTFVLVRVTMTKLKIHDNGKNSINKLIFINIRVSHILKNLRWLLALILKQLQIDHVTFKFHDH